MFGENPIRKQVRDDGSVLSVQEVFPTIQGEGPLAGTPAVFVRLAGCNLACTFCDTDFESKIDNMVTKDLLVAETLKSLGNSTLVVLTGGEPLRQNVSPYIDLLLKSRLDLRLQIETAGTVFPPSQWDYWVGGRVSIVCSPKTGKVHRVIEKFCTDWKYIISADDEDTYGDGLPGLSTQVDEGDGSRMKNALYRPTKKSTIWLQPMDEQDPEKNERNLKEVVSRCRKYGYRLSLQQHKILGLP